MAKLGYVEEAARVIDSLLEAVGRGGFREYYNPLTGTGLAARDFGFATLLIDLIAKCGDAAGDASDRTPMIHS
jgi:hypothetical protein